MAFVKKAMKADRELDKSFRDSRAATTEQCGVRKVRLMLSLGLGRLMNRDLEQFNSPRNILDGDKMDKLCKQTTTHRHYLSLDSY